MRKEGNKMLAVWLFIVSWCVVFLPAMARSQQVGPVTLTVGDGQGPPGSTANQVFLIPDNPDDRVRGGLQVDICRGSDLQLTGCTGIDRAAGFACDVSDQGNGCDRVILISLGGTPILTGIGPVVALDYNVALGATYGTSQILSMQSDQLFTCAPDPPPPAQSPKSAT